MKACGLHHGDGNAAQGGQGAVSVRHLRQDKSVGNYEALDYKTEFEYGLT